MEDKATKIYEYLKSQNVKNLPATQEDFSSRMQSDEKLRGNVYKYLSERNVKNFPQNQEEFDNFFFRETQPQAEVSTDASETPATPSYESGEGTELCQVNDSSVTRDDLLKAIDSDDFIESIRNGETKVSITDDRELENILKAKIQPPAEKKKEETIKRVSEDDPSVAKIMARSFESGISGLTADIYRTPEMVYDIAVNGYNKLLELQDMILPEGMESRKIATSEELSDITGIDNRFAENLEAHAAKVSEVNEKYRKPITESILDGNYGDAALNIGMSISESLPFTLSLMIPSAAGVSASRMFAGATGVMAAGRKQDLLSEDKDLTEEQMNTNAILHGMAEGLDVFIGGGAIGRAFKDVFKKQGKDGVKDFSTKIIDALLKEKPYLAPFTEGFQEAFTTFSQNVSDQVTGVDKNKNLLEGVSDAFIVGATMGTGSATVLQSAKYISNKQKGKPTIEQLNEITNNPASYNEVSNQIDALINTGDLTEQEGQELKTSIAEDVDANAGIPDNIEGKDREKAVDLQKKYTKAKINQEKASEAFKDLYKPEIDELKGKLQELALQKPTKEKTTVEQYGDKKEVAIEQEESLSEDELESLSKDLEALEKELPKDVTEEVKKEAEENRQKNLSESMPKAKALEGANVTIFDKKAKIIYVKEDGKGGYVVKLKDDKGLIRRIKGNDAEVLINNLATLADETISPEATKAQSIEEKRREDVRKQKAKQKELKDKELAKQKKAKNKEKADKIKAREQKIKERKKKALTEFRDKQKKEAAESKEVRDYNKAVEAEFKNEVKEEEKFLKEYEKELKEELDKKLKAEEARIVEFEGDNYYVEKTGKNKYKIIGAGGGAVRGNKRSAISAVYDTEVNKIKKAETKAAEEKLLDEMVASEDRVESALQKAIDFFDLSQNKAFKNNAMSTIGVVEIPAWAIKSTLQIVKMTYKATKNLAEAISAGYAYISKNHPEVKESDFNKFIVNELKKQLPSKKQDPSSGAKKPQEKQETAKTVTVEQDTKQKQKAAKERRKKLSNIQKKKTQVAKRFKKGGFFNKSLLVSEFISSLPRLSKIKDVKILDEIEALMKKLTESRVADVVESEIKGLTEKINNLVYKEEAEDSPSKRAERIINGLKEKAKKVKNVSNLVALQIDIDNAQTELDNAIQEGEFGDMEEGSDSKKRYDKLQDKINKATEELSNPKQSDSYGLIVSFKGDITRANKKIDKALKDGLITKERAEQLKNDLEGAKEQFEKEQKDFIETKSKEARENLKGITIESLDKEHGLLKPAKIILNAFLNQIKNFEAKTAVDAEVFFKISKALNEGFIPYNEIGLMIKNIKSEQNSRLLIPQISKVIDKVKKKASYKIARLMGETTGAFKSSALGFEFADSKVFETVIYTPIQQALKQANQESLNMANELGDKIKKAQRKHEVKGNAFQRAGLSIANRFNRALDSLKGKNSSRKASLRVGIIKNILNEATLEGEGITAGFSLESFKGDGSSVKAGRRDWLGIILGKEEALNDLDGDITEKTRGAILKGQMAIPFTQDVGVVKETFIKIGKAFGIHKADLDIMNEIWDELPKKENGAVDLDAIIAEPYKFMSEMEQGYFEAITEAFNESYAFIEVANMLKGMPIKRLNEYYKRSRFTSSEKEISYNEAGIHSNNLRIKAGSANLRTNDAVGAIDFNAINVAIQNIIESPRYFFIDQAGREVNSTLNKTSKETEFKNVVEGIKQDTAASLVYNFSVSDMPALMAKLTSARYAYSLLDPIRIAVLEGGSMILRGAWSNPKSIMNVFSVNDRRAVEKMEKDFGLKVIKRATGQIESRSTDLRITKDSDTPVRKKKITESLMGIPENITSIMFFLPSFNDYFFNLTGKNFDTKLYLKDPSYLKENKQYIEEAMNLASVDLERVVGSETRFGDRRYVRYAPKFVDKLFKGKPLSTRADKTAGRWLAFMTNYTFREGSMFFEPFKRGTKDFKAKSVANSVGVLAGGMYFTYTSAMYYGLTKLLFGDDEEKERALNELAETFSLDLRKGQFEPDKALKKAAEVAGDQALFYGVSRYGQLVRVSTIVSTSLLIDVAKRTKNKQVEKQLTELLKTKFYTPPVSVTSQHGLREFAAKNVPMLDMGIKLFQSMSGSYKMLADKYGDDFGERLLTMDFEGDEKDMLIAASALQNAINIHLALKFGTQMPMTPKIKYAIEQQIKKGKKTKRGIISSK
jgi:hypothetical protein